MGTTTRQQAIEQYFRTSEISSFRGTLSSLVQMISRSTGIYVKGIDILEYLYINAGVSDYYIEVCFAKKEIRMKITHIN